MTEPVHGELEEVKVDKRISGRPRDGEQVAIEAHAAVAQCAYETARLTVGPWHSLAEQLGLSLVDVVRETLSESTTRWLPPEWHGSFSPERALAWIEDRDAESPTLLAIDAASGAPIGLAILFDSKGASPGSIELRLGYVLVEAAWGQGYASELVAGLVEWARHEPAVTSIVGGVDRDNPASARVLTKAGFTLAETTPSGEQFYVVLLAEPGGVT